MSDIGVIAIGRNERERLRRCLASVTGKGHPVADLDVSFPFSAARARNAGFARLMQVAPLVRYVFFLDGDCEAIEGWTDHARAELEANPKAAVVCGRRRERYPEASIYNRLADV